MKWIEAEGLGLFYLRIGMGLMLLFSTFQKWADPADAARAMQTFLGFGNIGIVYLIAVLLDIVAILLLAGVFVRWISLFLSLYFIVVLVSGVLAAQFMEANLIKDVVYLCVSIALAFNGNGAWSLEPLLVKKPAL